MPVVKDEILKRARENKVEFVNLQFVDILGKAKSVTIPISKLDNAIESNIWFDGSSVEGFVRISESDMYLKPDIETFCVIPWETNERYSVARIICDVHTPGGEPFQGDPRFVLKQMLGKAAEKGLIYNTGPELEFFLFEDTDSDNLKSLFHDRAGYFDLTLDRAQKVRQEITLALQAMNIDVEALHHEASASQHEIDFKYDNALATADKAITLKFVVREIAKKHGLKATFMPKPIEGINGSGMHVHQSLFQGDKNAFFNSEDRYSLSDLAKYFIAGQLHYIKEICAVTNPTVNSYKRIVPGYEAPVYICWGSRNRSALMRIPAYTKGRERAVRCELRCPDPSANVYLAFALMLGAGLKGIEQKMPLSEPVEENIYHCDENFFEKKHISFLPSSLHESLEIFKNSSFCKEILGEYIFNNYITAKEKEWDSYRLSVSQWEKDRYLNNY